MALNIKRERYSIGWRFLLLNLTPFAFNNVFKHWGLKGSNKMAHERIGEPLYKKKYEELVKQLADKDLMIFNLQQERAYLQQRLDDLKELEQYLEQQRNYQRLVITPVTVNTRLR